MKYLSTFKLFESTKLAAMAFMGSDSEKSLDFYRPDDDWIIECVRLDTKFGAINVGVQSEDAKSETCNFIFKEHYNDDSRGFTKLFLELIGDHFQFDDAAHYKFVRYYLTKGDLLDNEVFAGYLYHGKQQGAADAQIQVRDKFTSLNLIKMPKGVITSVVTNYNSIYDRLKKFDRWDNIIIGHHLEIAQRLNEVMDHMNSIKTEPILSKVPYELKTFDLDGLMVNIRDLIFICYFRFGLEIPPLEKHAFYWTVDDVQYLQTFFINLG